MARKMKLATAEDVKNIRAAILSLRTARYLLVKAGASPRCVNRVRKALTSAGGAERHAKRRMASALHYAEAARAVAEKSLLDVMEGR